jgi:anaerobic selenocysteine-containing dehydrogenase
MTETTAICRFCHASCGIRVTIEEGRIVQRHRRPRQSCVSRLQLRQGASFNEFHSEPGRVLRSAKIYFDKTLPKFGDGRPLSSLTSH